MLAETTAREFHLSLEESLRLVFLYAAYEPAKLQRAALRWHVRYVTEAESVTLLRAQVALTALAELRTEHREAAEKLLLSLV